MKKWSELRDRTFTEQEKAEIRKGPTVEAAKR